jgi:quercetin dioxygenase-like cupin family protein
MGIFRLYTDADGHSRIQDQSLHSHPDLTKPQATAHIMFNQLPAGTFIDWHPAPRRQYVIILSGQLEIGLSDGSLRRFGPGDARLVEDISGKGHTTRVIGAEPVVTAVVPLADVK